MDAFVFGLKIPLFALFEILVLWIAILVTIIQFRKVSAFAAILLVPCITWTNYAAIFNTAIWLLN